MTTVIENTVSVTSDDFLSSASCGEIAMIRFYNYLLNIICYSSRQGIL